MTDLHVETVIAGLPFEPSEHANIKVFNAVNASVNDNLFRQLSPAATGGVFRSALNQVNVLTNSNVETALHLAVLSALTDLSIVKRFRPALPGRNRVLVP